VEGRGDVDECVFVNAGVGLVLIGGPFDRGVAGNAGNGFLVNVERHK
jgi:hypothetical protein